MQYGFVVIEKWECSVPPATANHRLKNRSKTGQIGPDRFSVNWPVQIEFFNNLKNFEIKDSKKTRVHFKIFGQNGIQKIKLTRSVKFAEV
jgi:hypothetical protein